MEKNLKFSLHCKERMRERGIEEDLVRKAIFAPEQIISKSKWTIFHKRYRNSMRNKEYLLRVFVEEKTNEREIMSVYRTSKIQKYWREEK